MGPPIMSGFTSPTDVMVRGVYHRLIGESQSNVGIADSLGFRKLMCQLLLGGTLLNESVFNKPIPPAVNMTATAYNNNNNNNNSNVPTNCQLEESPSLWK